MTESLINWPLNIDFTAAIQNPQVCFRDQVLRRSQILKNARGRVTLWSGNFATVYKLLDGDCAWAVRCFTRVPQSDVQNRYAAISDHLGRHQLPYLVNFEFVEQGITIRGEWYPVLKMEWVEGIELDRYIGNHVSDAETLMVLNQQLRQLKQDLRESGIAHGDLQHGNIMVTPQGDLKLVDYDGMYVPALKGKPPVETGHPNYQLPERSLSDFNEDVDDFSFDVISLSLRALAQQPELWDSFHEDNKNLIFTRHDFKQPDASPVFQSIAQINDTETQVLYAQLVQRCSGELVRAGARGQISPAARLASWLRLDIPQASEKALQLKLPRWAIASSLLVMMTLGLGIFMIVREQQSHNSIAINPPEIDTGVEAATSKPSIMSKEKFLNDYKAGKRDFNGVNLSGLGLSGAVLSEINLSAAILEGTDLHHAKLNRANLTGAVLAKADLRGIDLANANLNDANLTEAKLNEAVLTKATLLRANLSKARLDFATLQGAELMKADLTGANLGKADLRSADLVLVNFSKANLVKANLQESNLTAANLTEASLDSANLSLADLNSAELYLTNLSSANLNAANFTATSLTLTDMAGANLNGVDFSAAKVDNISSIKDASFMNAANLSAETKQYFCTIASGTFITDRKPTKVSLGCQ
jgi:uncharacterized protein YjbI with pentapeptide repeats